MRKLVARFGKLLGILVSFFGVLCLVLAFLQRSLIYFPTPLRDSAEPTIELIRPGATVRVAVVSRPGSKALLYFGGNAEDVSLSLPELSELFLDHSVYAMHYRGYNGSTGRPSEPALHGDAQALYDLADDSHSEIIVIGRSLGSGVAVKLAAENRVHRLILVTPFDSLVHVAKLHYPFLPVNWLLVDRFESWKYAPKIQAPTLILAAEDDHLVPLPSTQNLKQAFSNNVCQMHVIPNTDHNSIFLPPEIVRSFVDDSQ